MALAQEVEIVLRANSQSAKEALEAIQRQANSATDAVVKRRIEAIGDATVEHTVALMDRMLRESSESVRANLVRQADHAAQSIQRNLARAMDAGGVDAQVLALREMSKQMDAFKKLAEDDDLQKALNISVADAFSTSNLRDAVSGMSDVFEKALNGMDPNDLGGFVKSLGGAASKGLSRLGEGAKARQTAALASGDAALAAQMGAAATALAGTAAALTGIAAALALFVAWAKAADDYQAKLNKTLLSGASVADVLGVSYEAGGQNLLTLAETMGAARQAAVDTAVAFRMSTDETAQVLQELNAAGITYKTIVDGANSAAEAQERFALAINRSITYSSMLGISVGELVQYQNTLMKDVNLSMERTYDVFGAISEASKASGMATKTFFTAISQATSGMALYNVRIDQAIGLVSAFAKSVGETDAGRVLGELTGKKGTDERLRMVATAIEAVGIKQVQALFRDSAQAAADEFQRSFAGESDAIRAVFAEAGQGALGEGLMSADAAKRAEAVEALARLPDATREAIKAGMEGIQGGAASRAFGATAVTAKGILGDIDDLAGALNQLDMASKLALADMQLTLMAREGVSPEEAVRTATGQKFMEALGFSEEQVEPLLRSRAYLRAVENVRRPGEAGAGDVSTLEGAGFTVNGDKVLDKFGREVDDIADVFRGLTAAMETDDAAAARADAVERQRMQGTITDALNSWVQGSLFENALASQGLLGNILKVISKGEYDPERMAADRERKLRGLSDAQARVDEARDLAGAGDPAAQALAAQAEQDLVAARARAELPSGPVTARKVADALGGRGSNIQAGPLLDAAAAFQRASFAAMGTHDLAKQNARARAQEQFEGLARQLLGQPYRAGMSPEGPTLTPIDVDDAFISKDGAMYRGPSADNILMFKDGGPLDPRTGGGGSSVVINVNGGDQAMVYRTVVRAMRAAEGR